MAVDARDQQESNRLELQVKRLRQMSDERREKQRSEISGWIAKLTTGGKTVAGPIRDMGAGGIFIECGEFSGEAGECWVKMSRGNNMTVEVIGKIVRVEKSGVGIEFLNISADDYGCLEQLVRNEVSQAVEEDAKTLAS